MHEFKISERTITPRSSEAVRLYFQDVNRYDLLTMDEEADLAFLAQQGDEEAKEKLINSNLRFVISVANSFKNGKVPQADLIASGNIGLIRAVENFEPSRGLRFTSYAVWHIRAAILAALQAEGGIVHVPSNKSQELNRVMRFISKYEVENGLPPTTLEIAEGTSLSEETVEFALTLTHGYTSIDAPLKEGEDFSLMDVLSTNDPGTDSHLEEEALKTELSNTLSTLLSKREKTILEQYYGLNGNHTHTLLEIADNIGLSLERVRQLRNKALKTIRNSGHSNMLRCFL